MKNVESLMNTPVLPAGNGKPGPEWTMEEWTKKEGMEWNGTKSTALSSMKELFGRSARLILISDGTKLLKAIYAFWTYF